MQSAFLSNDLNVSFISSIKKYYRAFGPISKSEIVRSPVMALKYTDVEGPASDDMSRLIIIPIDPFPDISSQLAAAAKEVMDLVPVAANIFQNPAEMLHVTLFHTSRTEAPMPTGLNARQLTVHIENERQELMKIIQSTPPPKLTFHSLVMAESGVLLALWLDETDSIAEIRRRFGDQYPDAPEKQARIIHTTLFRIVSPMVLGEETRERLWHICQHLTERIKGLTLTPSIARIVVEKHFSTVEASNLKPSMSSKKAVHTIDSSELDEEDSIPIEVGSTKVPCSLQGATSALGGGVLGYVFGAGRSLLTTRKFKALHRSGLENASTFAVFGGVYAAVSCLCSRLRERDDIWNSGAAGCATGLVVAWKSGPVGALQGCLGIGLLSAAFDMIGQEPSQAMSIYGDGMMRKRKRRKLGRRKILNEMLEMDVIPWIACRQCRPGFWFLKWRRQGC